MTTIQVSLPDELAEEAARVGLLSDARMECLLREQIRKQRAAELFEAMERMRAVVEPGEMTPEEVSEELHAMRAERR